MSILLIDDYDTCGDAGAVKQVGRQADNPLDETVCNELFADVRLLVSSEQDAVREDDSTLASALQGFYQMKEKCIISVSRRRDTVLESFENVIERIHASGPGLCGEGRISHCEIE